MPQISLDCPYCFTKQAAFQGSSFCSSNLEATEFIMLMQCQVCKEGMLQSSRANPNKISAIGSWEMFMDRSNR